VASEESYDVIVLGAGPAGAACAWRCAELGLATLLLEAERFPRDKPCGGMVDVGLLEDVPGVEAVIDRRTTWTKTYLNYEYIGEHPNQNIMLLRRRFDEWVARRAERAGADLRDGHRVTDIDVGDGGVRVACRGGEAFRGKLLVDASGAKGRFFVEHKRAVERTIDYKIVSTVLEAPCPNEVMERRMGFDTAAGRSYFASYIMTGFVGYGWLFPKDGHMNAGLGTVTTRGAGLGAMFKVFLERAGFGDLDQSLATAGLIPVKVLPRLWLPRVLFVGDAGGFVDPLTGGGILLGMASGRRAADTAREAVAAGDFTGRTLRAYQQRCHDIERELALKTRILKWVTTGIGMGFDRPQLGRWVLRRFQRRFDSANEKRR
jgi:geranylgeranyl reductase family protein